LTSYVTMRRCVEGRWNLVCHDCDRVWHDLDVGPVLVRKEEQQEDSILAAIVNPGVADQFREHVRGHHDGRLPWRRCTEAENGE
jgi:hypothetical protein